MHPSRLPRQIFVIYEIFFKELSVGFKQNHIDNSTHMKPIVRKKIEIIIKKIKEPDKSENCLHCFKLFPDPTQLSKQLYLGFIWFFFFLGLHEDNY